MTSTTNKVSQNVLNQLPDFIRADYPAFEKFLQYYYKGQEKTGQPQNIVNEFRDYLNIDEYDFNLIQSETSLLEEVTNTADVITVESVDDFAESNGSLLVNDEIIYYEKADKSPEVSLTDGVSYPEFREKWIELQSPYLTFNGVQRSFPLASENAPIAPPSADHIVVRLFGKYLIPTVDFTISGTDIIFQDPPRSPNPSDSVEETAIFYLKGFLQDSVQVLDPIASQFNSSKTEFDLEKSEVSYTPVLTVYLNVIIGDKLLIPYVDYSVVSDGLKQTLKLKTAPSADERAYLGSIEAPITSFGTGATAVAQIDNAGKLSGIKVKKGGKDYRLTNPPAVTVVTTTSGGGASAESLVNGIKNLTLLDGGAGYSDLQPPIVDIQVPTAAGGVYATAKAKVKNGTVTSIELDNSGSNYTFTPRIVFKDPGGGKLSQPTLDSNNGVDPASIEVLSGGVGYTVPPTVYVDAPTGADPVQAEITATLTNGSVSGFSVVNRGRGYTSAPRIAIIDPGAAQILDVTVDSTGRVVDIELLSGGSGYVDIPSIYVVDNRKDNSGQFIGGTGTTAVS